MFRTFTHRDCTFRFPRASEWPVWASRLQQTGEDGAAVGVHLDLLASILQAPALDDARDWLDCQGPEFVASCMTALIAAIAPDEATAGK